MRGTLARYAVAGAMLVAVAALIPALFAAPVAASSPVTPSVTSEQWAYGGQKWINVTGTSVNGVYTAKAFVGWHVILTQTNTSATEFTLTVQRSMGAALAVSYCRPDCTTPIGLANVTVRAWEVDLASANFTTQGVVIVNGSPVPALALENSSEINAANLTQSYSVVTMPATAHHTASGTLWLRADARAAVEFSPALGLMPLDPTAGESWSATSDYNASGAWLAAYSLLHTFANGTSTHSFQSVSGSVAGNGTLTLAGMGLGTVALNHGVSASGVAIGVSGPFHPREGIIFLPGAADLFGESGQPWEASLSARPMAVTSVVDFQPHAVGHVGLVASQTTYTGSATAPVAATPVALASVPSDGTPPTVVQGQPETLSQAQVGSQCVTGSCLDLSTGSGGSQLPLATWLIPVVAVGVGAVLAALVISRRRRVAPPPPPTFSRFPPGAALTPPPSAPGPAPGKSPATPSDPLDHLW